MTDGAPDTDEEAAAGFAEVVAPSRNAEQLRAALGGLYKLKRGEGLDVARAYEEVITEFLRLTDPSRSATETRVSGALQEGWTAYSPAFAPHVKGSYSPRVYDAELGKHEPQSVRARCELCGEDYGPIECASGRVRQHVDAWAAANHLHRDRMIPRPVVKPAGS